MSFSQPAPVGLPNIWIQTEHQLPPRPVSHTCLDHVRCHWLSLRPGRSGYGEELQRGRPLHVPVLVRPGPRHTRRHGHHGGGVRRALLSRLVHLCGGHHHLPQPDLVGVVVHGEHRRAAQGAGGRCGNDEAEGAQSETAGEERVGAPLQQVQGLLQEERPECRRTLQWPRQHRKLEFRGDGFHFSCMNEGNAPTQSGDDPAETPTLQFSLFLLIFAFHSLVIIRQLPRLVQIRHICRYLEDKMGTLHGRIKRLSRDTMTVNR